ncbi:MAG: hypothetical protein WCS37_18205, partial [Chloroflexota bacterium]
MLISAVIVVRPVHKGQVPANLGRALMGVFYDLVGRVDEKLASSLHNSNQTKPFTVSNLCRARFDHPLTSENNADSSEDELGAEGGELAVEELTEETSESNRERSSYRPGRTDLITVSPESHYWFRFTTYHPSLSKLLLEKILPTLPTELKLLDVNFRVVEASTDKNFHPWAGSDSFEAISARQMLNPAPGHRFVFRFAS